MTFLARMWAYVTLGAMGIVWEEASPLIGGLAAHDRNLRLTSVVLAVALGTWLASLLLYGLGRSRSRWLRKRWPKLRRVILRSVALVRRHPWRAALAVRFAFGVPLRGSLLELAIICALGALSFGSLGLLIAARPRTVEGASGLMNLTMMPMWILSGVFFSSENFPRALQPLIHALPLTAVNDALRANMLRGAGFGVVGPELAIMTAWLVVCFVLALRLFRWR